MGVSQSSPAPPTITEENIGNLEGKVYLITGSTSGIGYQTAQLLYAAHAKVWIVGRSQQKGEQALRSLRESAPASRGSLELLVLDLDDLTTIKPAVQRFLTRESRLDVLFNNAGVMIPPKGSVTKQGNEAQIGVNALAPFLLTKLLLPILSDTAKMTKGVRVVWVSSSAAARFSPQGGVELSALEGANEYSQWQYYGVSKAAAILQSAELARLCGQQGITSVCVDPGNLDTQLYQNMPKVQLFIARKLALKPAIYGAYSELFAGLSEDIPGGSWVVPWGKVSKPRADIELSTRSKLEGGTGKAEQFWKWCDSKVLPFS